MFIIEYTSELYKYFTENSSLHLSAGQKDDFKKVIPITEDKEKDLAGLRIAMKEFEELGLVKHSKLEDGDIWFLKKHINNFEQYVLLDGETAHEVAEIINKFCSKIDDKKDLANPLKISHLDIKSLMLIIIHLMNKTESKN